MKKQNVTLEVMNAYADCSGAAGPRDLNYFAGQSVNGADLKKILAAAIPDGYNDFDTTSVDALVELFGENAEYYIAREGSVCVYIKPAKGNFWLFSHSRGPADWKSIGADEVLFDGERGMFRVWWD